MSRELLLVKDILLVALGSHRSRPYLLVHENQELLPLWLAAQPGKPQSLLQGGP